MTENKPLGLSDDFNYPPAKRLDVNWTLGREEATTRTKLKTLATREVNRTDDIDGAVTGTTGTNRYLTFLNRNKKGSPSQAGIRTNDPRLSTFDIPGAQSRFALPVSVKRTTDFSLTKSDIEGAQARERNFLSNRKVDPLCPRYALPNAVQPPPPPELPFRRDVLEINDIDGTRTRIKEQIRPRKYTPIDFTAEKPRRRLPSSNEKISLSLKADDICSVTTKRRTNVVDPLNPQYTIHGSNVDFCSHEKRRFHSQSTAQRNFSLRTDDITGAQHVSFIPPPQKRRQWKNTCDVSDIMEGGKRFTSASTRCTNPVNPCYHLPVNWTKTVSLV